MDRISNWNCCRTCNIQENLYAIFHLPAKHEQYSEILLQATGLRIKINDNLPQQMCSTCIQHINNNTDFRKRSQETYKIFREIIQNDFMMKLNSCTNENSNDADILQNDTDSNLNYELECISNTNVANLGNKVSKNRIYESDIEEILKKKYCVVFEKPKKYSKAQIVLSDNVKKKTKKEKVEGRIVCKYCSKEFKTKVALYNHYKVHNGAKIVCEHCGFRFTTKRRLLMHCRAKHGYEKVDKCSYCSYRASNAELVKIHERTHTGERPHVCSCCGAAFHRRSCYIQHAHTHAEHATVSCDECPAKFKSVTLMKIHKTKHKRKATKPI